MPWGAGYVEESIMGRLFRETPVNSIWEGSGNVMCLDVMRALHKELETGAAYWTEMELARGGNACLERALDGLRAALADTASIEWRARSLSEQMALIWQGALLVQYAPVVVADAFCASRLGNSWSGAYGTLPADTDFSAIIGRALGD